MAQEEHPQIYPEPGWVEHDPELLWHVRTARRLLVEHGVCGREVAAIGISNQRETTLPLGPGERAAARERHRLARPPVRPNGHLFGATEAGLFGAPIPIAEMAGDQQAATFGQACVTPGLVKNTYGHRLVPPHEHRRGAGRLVAQARLRP